MEPISFMMLKTLIMFSQLTFLHGQESLAMAQVKLYATTDLTQLGRYCIISLLIYPLPACKNLPPKTTIGNLKVYSKSLGNMNSQVGILSKPLVYNPMDTFFIQTNALRKVAIFISFSMAAQVRANGSSEIHSLQSML